MDFEQNSSLHDRLLKSRRLHARIRIVGNATPATKTVHPEMPEIIKVKVEGIDGVTASDAALSTDMSSKVDANGTFGVALLASELGEVERVISADVQPIDGGTCTVSLVNTGTTAYGKSALGNIGLNVDSSLSLAATNVEVVLSIDYIRRGN